MHFKTAFNWIGLSMLASVMPALSAGPFVYSYTGNNFTQISGSGGPTIANSITVSFETAMPLLANLTPWNSGNVTPLSGSISDGINTLSTQAPLFSIGVDTDQFGNIVKWLVQAQGPSPNGYVRLVTAYYGSGGLDTSLIWANGLQFAETSIVNNVDTPGAWSVSSSVPEPATGPLLVLALLVLCGRRVANGPGLPMLRTGKPD